MARARLTIQCNSKEGEEYKGEKMMNKIRNMCVSLSRLADCQATSAAQQRKIETREKVRQGKGGSNLGHDNLVYNA